ncbi:PREDICTED: UDP-N-acetylglucosamine transferase subunit ALG14 homolog isoform X3 [Ipomoea nil]|uniref:UDP-N-acetylglucosamine transferase subunit ALG14 homolog isoform X3 n=1 Tax=Ipomoea nil TaxID=35883 RepID=UPI00090145C5|nr:PREDICTED: UDP-N-acetylglucosamine transferase subunit ALG14 homolog isoform X3 [Ipomoea nil]
MEKGSGRCIYDAVPSNSAILLFVGVVTIVIIRVLFVMYRSTKPLRPKSPPRPLCTLIVLGSGGHTAEMMNLLFALQEDRFKPRFYIAATTDNMSLQKARVFEDSLVQKAGTEVVGTAQFMQIYRSREVGQSYITSIATTLIAIAHGLWLMIKIRPEVILCNGPGTCIPICVIAFFLKDGLYEFGSSTFTSFEKRHLNYRGGGCWLLYKAWQS